MLRQQLWSAAQNVNKRTVKSPIDIMPRAYETLRKQEALKLLTEMQPGPSLEDYIFASGVA